MRLIRVLGFAALLVVVATAAGQEEGNYFPLKVGSKWVYKVRDQKEAFILIVTKEEKVGEQACLRLEGRIEKEVVSNEHVAQLKDGVYRFKVDENLIGPPICFLKLPPKKGEKWENEFKIKGKAGKVTYVCSVEDVEVPAGKYKDAILITGETIENNVANKLKSWFVKDVGMVKQVIEFGKESTILELEKTGLELPK